MIVHCLCVAVIFLHITVQFKKLLVKNIRTAKFLVIFEFLQIDSILIIFLKIKRYLLLTNDLNNFESFYGSEFTGCN